MAKEATEAIKGKLERAFPGIKLKLICDSLLLEDTQDLSKVAKYLKEDPELQFDFLSSLTGADYVKFLESVYHLYSIAKRAGSLVLRVRVPRDNAKVPSLVPVYRGAEYQEREAFDMYGIVYEGHPDLRRIFMWDDFEGYPMRKDYVQEDSETLEDTDFEWLEKNGVKITEEMRKRCSTPQNAKAQEGEKNE